MYSKLLRELEQKNPLIIDDFIVDYFKAAEEQQESGKFNFGHNSLKWALYRVNSIAPDQFKTIVYGILCEYRLYFLTREDIEYNILKSVFLEPFRDEICKMPTVAEIKAFEAVIVGDYVFVLNNTENDLSNRIFKYHQADGVIHINSGVGYAGIILRIGSRLCKDVNFKVQLKNNLLRIEPGWSIEGNKENIIVNTGKQNGTPSSVSVKTITNLLSEQLEN